MISIPSLELVVGEDHVCFAYIVVFPLGIRQKMGGSVDLEGSHSCFGSYMFCFLCRQWACCCCHVF